MSDITIFNNNSKVAKTSKAFNAKITQELMRAYTLSFSLTNNNDAVKYINQTAQFVAEGQLFDIVSFDNNIGNDNITSVTAEHYSYRLNKYKLNIMNYSFVGTVRELAEDILDLCVDENGNSASSDFTVGITPNLGTISFSLNNTSEVTARYAILALKGIGVEMEFDNCNINFSEQIGLADGKTFKFGVDLKSVKRNWTKSNGETINVDIANLQRIDNCRLNAFGVGDYVTIDTRLGNSVIKDQIKKRIITYTKCLDDPTKDNITVGKFISNITTDIAKMSVDVDKSIKQGQEYNNVSISHAEGFHANAIVDGVEIDTYMNASQGFEVRADGITKFFVGGDGNVYTSAIGTDNLNYGTIGNLSGGGMGLELFDRNELFCSIAKLVGGGFGMFVNNFMRFSAESECTNVLNKYGAVVFQTNDNATTISFGNTEIMLMNDAVEIWYGNQNAIGVDSVGAFKVKNKVLEYL